MAEDEAPDVTLQDIADHLAELREMWGMATGQQDQRINDLVELVQEMDAKIDELQESLDELGMPPE
jgi:hypothetical protein